MEHLRLILLIASFVLPLALGIILLLNCNKQLSRVMMAALLFNVSLFFLFNYFLFNNLHRFYSFTYSLHSAIMLWVFPFIYLYLKSILLDWKGLIKELWHLIPGLVVGLVSALLFYGLLSSEEQMLYLMNHGTELILTVPSLKMIHSLRLIRGGLVAIQVLCYFVLFIRLRKGHRLQLEYEFSDIEKLSIDRMKWYNIFFMLMGLLCVSLDIFIPLRQNNDLLFIFFLFLFSLAVWALGITSFKQQEPETDWVEISIEHMPIVEDVPPKDNPLLNKLINYLETNQAFLQPNLSLTFTARQLGTNRTYLSTLINNEFGVNFNTYINQYRMDYINRYLNDHPGVHLEDLVHEGGFGSASTLKRAMKNAKQSAAED